MGFDPGDGYGPLLFAFATIGAPAPELLTGEGCGVLGDELGAPMVEAGMPIGGVWRGGRAVIEV